VEEVVVEEVEVVGEEEEVRRKILNIPVLMIHIRWKRWWKLLWWWWRWWRWFACVGDYSYSPRHHHCCDHPLLCCQ